MVDYLYIPYCIGESVLVREYNGFMSISENEGSPAWPADEDSPADAISSVQGNTVSGPAAVEGINPDDVMHPPVIAKDSEAVLNEEPHVNDGLLYAPELLIVESVLVLLGLVVVFAFPILGILLSSAGTIMAVAQMGRSLYTHAAWDHKSVAYTGGFISLLGIILMLF